MKNLLNILCKLVWGAFLLLSSVYLLLAFLPYTYVALVKAPPFGWVLWFVAHYSLLYWTAWIAGVIVFCRRPYHRTPIALLGVQPVLGFFLPHFMSNLQCDGRAFAWSLALLLLAAALSATFLLGKMKSANVEATGPQYSLDYSTGLFAAAAVALLATSGEAYAHRLGGLGGGVHLARLEIALWSLVAHVLVAIAAISVLNLVYVAASRTPHAKIVRPLLAGILFAGGLWFGLARFLESALSFHGWQAQLYAVSLATALTLLGFSVAIPALAIFPQASRNSTRRKVAVVATCVALAFAVVAFPSFIGGSDWNGFLQAVVALGCWLTLSLCAYALQPPRAKYSVATILAVLMVAVFAYKGLQATEIFWAKALGSTDDEVVRALENYAEQDASFNLAHQLLGNTHPSDCGDLCRIMREYANIRDARVKTNIDLVDALKPATGERPDIFIFVIDSLRPDYLGAYSAKVDFSPNLDAFARDSVAVHNTFTQYAGTSLSEPVIWSGMELLHAHYMQPFSKVNSLQKLAAVDGYRMVVSWDDVLRQLLPADGGIIKLDTDKALWNEFEVCSTIQQTEHALDSGATQGQPVFFYAQPKNVHQFAHNNLPGMRATHWQTRPGFQNRIAYEVHQVDECMGQFFVYLKEHGRYDNSVIIVTSDHGDATGEFGRTSHSLSIYPEVMRVPLLIHLPENMRGKLVYDDQRISALADIAPTLYYLLGHRPVIANPLFGHPLLAESQAELHSYRRDELFLASDERAVFGILADNGRYLYATYDSPAQSYLFDLANDPNALRNLLTPALKREYDQRVITHLQAVAEFYGYRPKFSTLLAAGN